MTDSQVLPVAGLNPWCRASLANWYSFDIIRAIEFATHEDFISLKPKPEKLAKKDPAKSRVKNRD
ncbi:MULTISPECIES: hypothetical protein [unclassified Pseudomonas]|uniref:hypothetical protein n=1 Tax=Pseudomonas sp. A-R-26 TaxID=2832404 RepID=UPI001CBA89DD|nr:hypothetical protein [Pseudomonas sp. A-R-26]